MSIPELEPCPFCGGSASPEEGSHAEIGAPFTVTIFCDGCHASSCTELTQEAAAKAWNTRPSPVEVEGLVERDEAARVVGNWLAADAGYYDVLPADYGVRQAIEKLRIAALTKEDGL